MKKEIKGGDQIVITKTDGGWESLIGKSASVCETNDSTDPEKLKVDFENGFVGYFKQDQMRLDNDLTNSARIIQHIEYMTNNNWCKIEPYQLANIRGTLIQEKQECVMLKAKNKELVQKIIDLENQLSIFKTKD